MTRVAAIDCGTNTIRLLIAEADRDQIAAIALADATIQSHIADKTVVKQIVVPGRMVNLVVK